MRYLKFGEREAFAGVTEVGSPSRAYKFIVMPLL
jgi:hypothetical protein